MPTKSVSQTNPRRKRVLGENFKRAEWADTAMEAFIAEVGDNEDPSDNLMDLLCNLIHWADLNGISFTETMQRARRMYRMERKEDNFSYGSSWEDLHS